MEFDIKAFREEMKLTQEELARLIGISCATVNRWENGKQKPSKMAIKILQELKQKKRKPK